MENNLHSTIPEWGENSEWVGFSQKEEIYLKFLRKLLSCAVKKLENNCGCFQSCHHGIKTEESELRCVQS